MNFTRTEIESVWIIDVEQRRDDRGFFARTYCENEFEAHGLNTRFVQMNMSFNHQVWTLRGIHWQSPPHAETKVIRCTRGRIFDVAVDLRHRSPTFLRWIGIELSAFNARSLYIPEGFGHGYLTLESDTEVHYLVSSFYQPDSERGARWDDQAFKINWPEQKLLLVSERDKKHPPFQV